MDVSTLKGSGAVRGVVLPLVLLGSLAVVDRAAAQQPDEVNAWERQRFCHDVLEEVERCIERMIRQCVPKELFQIVEVRPDGQGVPYFRIVPKRPLSQQEREELDSLGAAAWAQMLEEMRLRLPNWCGPPPDSAEALARWAAAGLE